MIPRNYNTPLISNKRPSSWTIELIYTRPCLRPGVLVGTEAPDNGNHSHINLFSARQVVSADPPPLRSLDHLHSLLQMERQEMM